MGDLHELLCCGVGGGGFGQAQDSSEDGQRLPAQASSVFFSRIPVLEEKTNVSCFFSNAPRCPCEWTCRTRLESTSEIFLARAPVAAPGTCLSAMAAFPAFLSLPKQDSESDLHLKIRSKFSHSTVGSKQEVPLILGRVCRLLL